MSIVKARLTKEQALEIRRTLLHLHARMPFWAALVRHTSVVASRAVPTAAVTPADVVLVNPEYFFGLTTGQRIFLLAHEAAHLALRVFERLGARNRLVWNVAQDLLINELVLTDFKQRFKTGDVPPGALLLRQSVSELTSDQLYEMIMHLADEAGLELEGARHASAGRRLCAQHPDIARELRERILPFLERYTSDLLEEAPEDGKVLIEGEQDGGSWEFRVRRALAHSRLHGTQARGAEIFARVATRPRVHWRLPLAAAIRQLAARELKLDYTFMHPNHRRMQGGEVVLPTMTGARGRAVFAVDTSGSMLTLMPDGEHSYLEQALAELDSARRQFQLEVYLINCDANVYVSGWIQPYEPLPEPKGGGGTSFVPVFQHIEERKLRPNFVVVLTDGEGTYPETPPPYDVIWVVFGDRTPPFGQVIRVEL
ncbi:MULTISPECIES: VWA-like domain-containing protein [Bacteria]|uniref:vWA domain-containing protein n=1 Tax=Pseudomonadati TaxID=3379134 RepID=UPI000223D0E8|nr:MULTISPECIES: VWA-like domain-containing protein [Bacteria]AEN74738.1 Protein of unknown function DUF2201, metallopeptidase-related protein [Rhodothermus marinus SG0.5JP17-172]